jgi:glycosyltransferase involved in cell wall biosynthesis
MKIVHVISSIDPAQGGPQSACVRLAAAQAALGHDVHIMSYGGIEVEKRAFKSAQDVPFVALVHWHLLDDPDRMEQILCVEGSRQLRQVLKGASFVHIHGVWEPILRKAANTARSNRIPYCVQPHGMLDAWSMKQKQLKKRIALLLGYRKMLDQAKFLVTLNNDESRLLEPLRLKAPTLTIPNGIFLEEYTDLPGAGFFRERLSLARKKRVILFLSRLHTKKGLDILADAFKLIAGSHPDVDLVVAGPDGGAREGFVSQIDRLHIADRVHLIGPIYGEDKLRALVDARCFCLPSRQEGFSVAIIEALACGLPAVISDACHFPEVETANAGVVVPLDPADVAFALASVLDNPAMASTMGQNGQRLVRENYTWPRIAELTIHGYNHNPKSKILSGTNRLVAAIDH